MAETYNVQEWIKGDMQSFTISDNGNDETDRDPVVIAEVFVNEDLGQSQEEAETTAANLARLFAAAPGLLKTLQATYGALTPEQKGSALGVIIHESIQRATA